MVAGAGVAFAASIVWPALALVIECARDSSPPSGGFQPGVRQWLLLARTAGLASGAVLFCLVLAIPGILAVRRLSGSPGRGIIFLAGSLLLCPPMVYAFGWDRGAPWLSSPTLRCLLVWSLWAWPIPAWIIGSAWSKKRYDFHEPASLETDGPKLWITIVLPTLMPYVGLSGIILFVLFFNDYGVPHACGLTVYATELLAWATSSARPIDTLAPALPSVGVTMVALTAAMLLWRRHAPGIHSTIAPNRPEGSQTMPVVTLATMLSVSWIVPLGVLVMEIGTNDVRVGLRTYAPDMIGSLVAGLVAGVVVIGIAVGSWTSPKWHRVLLFLAIIFGALPGALVGEGIVAAYNRSGLNGIYSSWAILSIAYVARFAWVGLCVAGILRHQTSASLAEQADTDGATPGRIVRHIVLALHGPALCAGIGLVTILGTSEVPTASMVRPPGLAPVSLVIIEKFHRFEDGLMITLCLALVVLGVVSAGLWALLAHRSQKITG